MVVEVGQWARRVQNHWQLSVAIQIWHRLQTFCLPPWCCLFPVIVGNDVKEGDLGKL